MKPSKSPRVSTADMPSKSHGTSLKAKSQSPRRNKNTLGVDHAPKSPQSPRSTNRKIPERASSEEATAPLTFDEVHPMVSMAYRGGRHLHPQRLPSAKKERAVSLRLLKVDDSTIEKVQALSASLKRLDVNNLKLETISEEMVSGLKELEKLDFSFNSLSEDSLPECLAELPNLVELNLYGNHLQEIPGVIKRMKNLSRLYLGDNKLENIRGLEKLKKLKCLSVGRNQLTSVIREVLVLRRLEILDCNDNLIREIPKDVRFLKVLRELDISNNKLTTIPAELFQLPCLEVLDASNNMIQRVPTLSARNRVDRRIASVDLSNNQIIRMPEFLLLYVDRLDLCSNLIKRVNGDVIRRFDWKTDTELMMSDNPLVSPSIDVCEGGLKSMIHFFMEENVDRKIYQGIKVIVLGAPQCGKTSLVQSLVDGQSRLTEEQDATVGMEASDFSIELAEEGLERKTLHLSIWDTSGDPFYLNSHTQFVDSNCLVMLAFNLATYDAKDFKKNFGTYIDWLICKNNKLPLLLVGTHKDQVSPDQIHHIQEELSQRIDLYIKDYQAGIEHEIKLIESRPKISPSLTEQLRYYMNLVKSFSVAIHGSIITCSSKDFDGFDDLQKGLEIASQNQKMFPDVMQLIPSLWGNVDNYMEDLGNSLVVPVISWDEYEEKITQKFGMRHLLDNITKYLHNSGKILWFGQNKKLSRLVFLRPPWLHCVLSDVIRHDVETSIDYVTDDTFRLMGMNRFRFDRLKSDLLNDGVLERDLMKCLWNKLAIKTSSQLNECISIIADHLQLGYAVGKKGKLGRFEPFVAQQPKDHSSSQTQSQTEMESSRPSSSHKSERVGSASSQKDGNNNSTKITNRENQRQSQDSISAATPDSETPTPSSATNKQTQGRENSQSERSTSLSTTPPPRISRLLIPWCRKVRKPQHVDEEWDAFRDHTRIATVYRFPRYCPPGFFHQFSVKASVKKHNLTILDQWDCGMHVQHIEKKVRLLFTCERSQHDTAAAIMRLEIRSDTLLEDEQEVSELWNVLYPLLCDVEDIIKLYAGIRFERYTACPACFKTSFLGEWMTPKDLQAVSQRTCEACEKSIPTVFLVQPKAKKTGLNLSKLKRHGTTSENKTRPTPTAVGKLKHQQGRK